MEAWDFLVHPSPVWVPLKAGSLLDYSIFGVMIACPNDVYVALKSKEAQ